MKERERENKGGSEGTIIILCLLSREGSQLVE